MHELSRRERAERIKCGLYEVSFSMTTGSHPLTVTSGKKWSVSDMPDWTSIQSITGDVVSPYKWLVSFSASENNGYNREGTIVIKTSEESVDVSVKQEGKKGEYVPVATVSLSSTKLSLTEGDTYELVATINPSNASEKSVSWSSSNTSVATVSSTGIVTANSVGTTTITVKTDDGGKTANCSVTVKPVSVSSVSLDKETLTLKIGETYSLTATLLPENAANKRVSWSSSNTSVATVDSNGKVSAISVGSAIITVTTEDGGKKATCSVSVNPIPVTGVSLNKTSMTLLIGGTEQLMATVSPSNATNKNVTWSSSNTDIATVDSNGNVSAIKVGNAIITVKTEDGGKTATCSVTVNPIAVTNVSLNQTSLAMTVGDTQTLTATVSPSNATDKSVTWSSSNTSVATVNSSGLVSAKAAGTATITVTTNDGGKKATCSVTVQAQTVSVTGVSLNKTSLSMTVGDTQTLTATVIPSNATNKSVTWSSSNTSVATVSTSGVVTAKAAGSATITVTTSEGGKTATCSVTVQAQTVSVTEISLDKTSLSMTVGDTQTLTATVTPSNATNKTVTWSSSNTSVATVSTSGVVTAKAAGSATITVITSDGNKSASCTVTVTAASIPVTSIEFNNSQIIMTKDGQTTIVATVYPSNATNKTLTWKSSDTSIASVDQNGKVTANSEGDVTITATSNDSSVSATCSVSIRRLEFYKASKDYANTSVSIPESKSYECTLDEEVYRFRLVDCTTQTLYIDKDISHYDISVLSSSSSGVIETEKTTMSFYYGTGVLSVYFKKAGTAQVKLTYNNNNGASISQSITLSIQNPTVPVTGVSLSTSTLSMTVGDSQTLTATVTPSNATNKSVTWSSSNTSVAMVSTSGVVTAKAAGSATITVATSDGGKTATCSVTVSEAFPEAIDLGLSVKWASANIGATTPEAYGDYYAWGETETKTNYNFTTYRFGTSAALTKYNTKSSYGTVDNKTVLDKESNGDDVASKKLGGKWRMPTDAEWTELLNECTWTWTTQSGVKGYKVTANNGNSIFLPAAGYRLDTGFVDKGIYCSYWSSSLRTDLPYAAWGMFADSGSFARGFGDRCYGQSIRPVID